MSESSSDSEEIDSAKESESKQDEEGTRNYPTYTQEQKIVAAVWVHEKPYNYQTMDDIQNNFRIRFRTEPPSINTLVAWERRLFSSGTLVKEKNRKPMERLIHVPYVKASLREKPNLSMAERACQLGLSKNRMKLILKYDIKDSELNRQNDKNTKDSVRDRN